MTTTKMNILYTAPELQSSAEKLGTTLNLPIYAEATSDIPFSLIVTPDYLGIKKNGTKSSPLYIDFLSAKLTYRRKQATVRRETLARALGLKNQTTPTILDATTGLARDSFILASLGFSVTMLERSPVIYALLTDAFQRAAKDPEVSYIIARMQLCLSQAQTFMCEHRFDIVYLDPMFPERGKSAQVKKDMQIFHEIVGDDEDSASLLPQALACATKRVVVKRPRIAGCLNATAPSFSMSGSSSRFDIYLI